LACSTGVTMQLFDVTYALLLSFICVKTASRMLPCAITHLLYSTEYINGDGCNLQSQNRTPRSTCVVKTRNPGERSAHLPKTKQLRWSATGLKHTCPVVHQTWAPTSAKILFINGVPASSTVFCIIRQGESSPINQRPWDGISWAPTGRELQLPECAVTSSQWEALLWTNIF